MSGFGGLVSVDGAPVTQERLRALAAPAAKRAIDGAPMWDDGCAGFVRLLHHTTGESRLGPDFPITPDQSILCFDGRIDNRDEVLALLGMSGAALSDAMMAALLFARFGEDCLGHLVGDWALARWNPHKRELFVARAPVGWRPVHWAHDGRTFGFATEPVMLIRGLALPRTPDEAAIAELLAGRFVTERDTLWAGVKRLPQGSALRLRDGNEEVWRWFRGPFADQSHHGDDVLAGHLLEHIDTAVRSCMRSASPVAAQLSGGLDSSSVVSRAMVLSRTGMVDFAPHVFSARFPGEAQDETVWSEAVESHLGIQARVMAAEPFAIDMAREWTRETLQLPLRPNVTDVFVPTLRSAASEGLRVLLTGEGGDDWLAGHLGHLADLAAQGDWRGLWQETGLQFPSASAARRLWYGASLGIAPLFSSRRRATLLRPLVRKGRDIPSWIRSDWARRLDLVDRWADAERLEPLASFAQRQRYGVYAFAQRYIGYESVQAFSERMGVELRHPLHDLRLTRFVMGLPGNTLRRGPERKHLLREAMRGTLPEIVRKRMDKARFVRAIHDAVLGYFKAAPPEEMRLVRLGWIDPRVVRHGVAVASQDAPIEPAMGINRLWFLMAIEIWLEHAALID